MVLQTEYQFTLPKGYVDSDGGLHREGVMRLANASDEILPLKDPRVKNNNAYLTVILLSRVLTKLGELNDVSTKVIEGLFIQDLTYLQELYQRVNGNGELHIQTKCPECNCAIETTFNQLGG